MLIDLALAHALRDLMVSDATQLRVIITGVAGGVWSPVRTASHWVLESLAAGAEAALPNGSLYHLWFPANSTRRCIFGQS